MWPKKHVETSLSSNAIAQNSGERLEMNITHNRIALTLNANEMNKDQRIIVRWLIDLEWLKSTAKLYS